MATYYKRNTNPTNTNWNQNDNWSTVSSASSTNTGTFPIAGDVAIFDSGSVTCTVNVNSACTTLTMTGYNTNLVMSANLTVSGTCTLPSGASGALTSTGTLILSSGTQTLTTNNKTIPALTFSTSGTKTITGTSTISGLFTVAVSGTATLNGGTFNIDGGLSFTGNGAVGGTTALVIRIGTISSSGSVSVTSPVSWSGSGAITISTSTLTLPNLTHTSYTGTFTIGSGYTLGISGNIDLNASASYVAGDSVSTLSLNGVGTFTSNAVTLPFNLLSTTASIRTLADNLTLGSGKTFSVTTANATFNGFRIYLSGAFSVTTNLSGTTVFEFNTNSVLNTGNGIIVAPVVLNGNVNWAGSLRFGANATVTYTSGTITASSGTLSIAASNVTLSLGSNVVFGTVTTTSGTLPTNITLNDNLYTGSITAGSNTYLTFNSATYKVYVSANLPTSNVCTISGTAPIIMNGTGTISNNSMLLSGTVEINTSGTITLGNVVIGGTFKYIAGSITKGSGSGFGVYSGSTMDIGNIPTRIDFKFINSGASTLASNLVCGRFGTSTAYSGSFTGSYDIDCDDLQFVAGSTFTWLSTQDLIVRNSINNGYTPGVASVTFTCASGTANFNYLGTMANCQIYKTNFTNIDGSGSSIPIFDWYGTVSGCTNIYAVTGANLQNIIGVI